MHHPQPDSAHRHRHARLASALTLSFLAVAVAPARAEVQESVDFMNFQSVDLLGDPDNDVRQFSLTGGYTGGVVHIFGTWSNPVAGTTPFQSRAMLTGPGNLERVILLSFINSSSIVNGTPIVHASLSFEGIDPAGEWTIELYESSDNAPGAPDVVWSELRLEFEDQNIIPNGADLTICQLFGLTMFPDPNKPLQREGDVVGLSLATTSWNIGDHNLIWLAQPDERHPFISMAMYRIDGDDRFEQIGTGWVKHAFHALSNAQCGGFCSRTNGQFLGVGCTDTYTAMTNSQQNGLGPRSEIDPWTGEFTFAGSALQVGIAGGDDNITRRMQVHDDDLDPTLNPGAEYRVECYYVARDDSNATDNAAWKDVSILGMTGSQWNFGQTAANVPPEPGFALEGWTGARLTTLAQQLPVDELTSPDGRCILGAKAIDEGGGLWRYQYALLNIDMARQVGRFEVDVPFGVQVSDIGFSAPLHHGEPTNVPLADGGVAIDNAPWSSSRETESVAWETTTNPLRWGTLYSFWFTADQPPTDANLELGLFRPGMVTEVTGVTDGPIAPTLCVGDADGDGQVNFADITTILSHWLESGPLGDANADAIVNFADITTVLGNWLTNCL